MLMLVSSRNLCSNSPFLRHSLPSERPCSDNPVVDPKEGFTCGCILAKPDSILVFGIVSLLEACVALSHQTHNVVCVALCSIC